jgi:hypothetical protein
MSHRSNAELPACWRRPTVDCQPTFFPQPVDALLADVRVTRDDLRRWKCLGWLSFDVDCADTLDLPEEKEIRFVRHLVMAGFGNSEIERLLNDGRRHSFDVETTAYHFAYGWVTPTIEEPFEVVDANVEDWFADLADSGDIDRLKCLADKIAEHIESLGKAEDELDAGREEV